MITFHRLVVLALCSLFLFPNNIEAKKYYPKSSSVKIAKKNIVVYATATAIAFCGFANGNNSELAKKAFYIGSCIGSISLMYIFWFLQNHTMKGAKSYAFDIVCMGVIPIIRTGICVFSHDNKIRNVVDGLHTIIAQIALIKNTSEACYHKIEAIEHLDNPEENIHML